MREHTHIYVINQKIAKTIPTIGYQTYGYINKLKKVNIKIVIVAFIVKYK